MTAVDPVHATPPAELVGRLTAALARGTAWVAAHAERYVQGFHGDLARYDRRRVLPLVDQAGRCRTSWIGSPFRVTPE